MKRSRAAAPGQEENAFRAVPRPNWLRACRAALCLAAFLLVFLLCACHGAIERAQFSIPETFDENRQFSITFWAKNDTNKTQIDIYNRAIADFEALYPNIKVNMRLYTDYGRIYNDVITNIATGTTPNVCITYPDHIATYLTGQNSVVALDALFADPKYGLGGSALRFESPTLSEIVPQFLEECLLNGQHYAIPYMRSTEACYVNKDYVEALGYTLPETLTWDFVWEVSEAAAAKNPDGTYVLNGQKVMIPFLYKSTDNMMIQLLRQRGGGYSTENGEILIFNDTTKEILRTVAEEVGKGVFSTFKISGYPANFLNAGQCLFAVDSTAGATWMGSDAPLLDISPEEIVRFETVVYPVPQVDPDHPQMISQGPSICLFNKQDPQEVLASWLFAQYLLTNDVQIAYSSTEGYVPVTTRAQQSAEYQEYLARAGEDNLDHYAVKLAAAQLLLDHTLDTFVTPVFSGSASLRDAAGQMLEDVTKSIRRKQTVDDAYFDKLFTDTAALYHLDQVGGSNRAAGKAALGPMPLESKVLLGVLALAWLGMGLWVLFGILRRKRGK